jgi:hypothetical protein
LFIWGFRIRNYLCGTVELVPVLELVVPGCVLVVVPVVPGVMLV